MTLSLSMAEHVARARGDLRMGVPVVLRHGASSYLMAAAETLTPERLTDLQKLGSPSVAITRHRADTLKARAYDGDIARISVAPDMSVDWIRALADPADDLNAPMKGPFHSLRDGNADPHRAAITLVKTARLLPAVLVVELSDSALASVDPDLTQMDVAQLSNMLGQDMHLNHVSSAKVPMALANAGRLHVFRPDDGGEEHYAIEIGRLDTSAPVLTRLHSACFTGDILGSLKCDCGPQLHTALKEINSHGSGVLLYLNQEGRGIGLANKMRAYSLQDQGFDTVEANHRLGFEDDERDFRIGAQILKQMNVRSVRLLTNNPAKVAMMQANGIEVADRVPLKVGTNALNAGYLATKANKSGHLL
ncbi:MAG: GTP cyclohydrolase II [Marinosulfonomonas sp.]